jgi:hypothetical protein
MNTKRDASTFTAIAAALCGSMASAETPPGPRESERSVADIVREARERVEGKRVEGWTPPNSQDIDKDPDTSEEAAKSWDLYLGFGFENNISASLDGIDSIRAAQRDATPLQYLETVEEHEVNAFGSMNVVAGFNINRWLDAELVWHGLDSYGEVHSNTPVNDPTLPGIAQETVADQYTYIREQAISLTVLAHWRINDYVSIVGRAGVGYEDVRIRTSLKTSGWTHTERICETDKEGNQTCANRYAYVNQHWGHVNRKQETMIPVVGIGLTFLDDLFRIEYLHRFNVPMGDRSTDFRSGIFMSFTFKRSWSDGSF